VVSVPAEAFPARVMRAIVLADYLDGAGIRARRAATMDTQQWTMLSNAAAVRVPSEGTRVMVISILQAREQTRKQLAPMRRRRKASRVPANLIVISDGANTGGG
jgi:hypothetical protein